MRTSFGTFEVQEPQPHAPHNPKYGPGRAGCTGTRFSSLDVASKSRIQPSFPRTVRSSRRSQAVFDSSARCETALSLESRAAQLNHESTMERKGRTFPFRIGNEAQALWHRRTHLLTEHHQLVQEGDCPKDNFFGIMWIAYKDRMIGNLKRSLEIEISFAENQIPSTRCVKRSEISTRLSKTAVQTLSHPLEAARDNSGHL